MAEPTPQQLYDRVRRWERELKAEYAAATTDKQRAYTWLGISDCYMEQVFLLMDHGDEIVTDALGHDLLG